MMSGAHSLTSEQAASLRCYLAVSDLAAYALDGKQLSPESLVDPRAYGLRAMRVTPAGSRDSQLQ